MDSFFFSIIGAILIYSYQLLISLIKREQKPSFREIYKDPGNGWTGVVVTIVLLFLYFWFFSG